MKIRDKSLKEDYFDIYISKKRRIIDSFKTMLDNGDVDNDRINDVKNEIFKQNCFILIAQYSAGYPVENLYQDYYEAVDYMHQSWMVLDNRAYLKGKYFNHYFGSDYDLMLWTLSIGYLLNVDDAVFNKVVEIVDKYPVRDLLYETIIKAKIPTRPTIEQESYQLIMDMPFVYEKLRRAVYCNDDEWGKIDAAEYTRLFLKDDFYQRHKGFSFYGHHKSTANIYYGYWSFETAAITKILNVDVSTFENNKYFPKDMYYWAKEIE
jgi:hypothetical protein